MWAFRIKHVSLHASQCLVDAPLPPSTPTPRPFQSPALRYPLHGADHSESALRAFMAEFAAGTLTAFVKSAPPPAVNDGPVRVIVGSTLAAETSDATKDVLVEVRIRGSATVRCAPAVSVAI
jgi:hypothetical protein